MKEYDVIIVGGGISGTMSAIAASKRGTKVLLIERYNALGGMATQGLVQPITTWGFRGEYVLGGIGRKILENMHRKNPLAATAMSLYGSCCDTEFLKYELEKEAIQANVEILYYTNVCDVSYADKKITELKLFNKNGFSKVSAKIIIDATGDADIATLAKVPYEIGHQGMTLMMVVAGVKKECVTRENLNKIYAEHAVNYRNLCLFSHPRNDAYFVNMSEVENHSGIDTQDLTKATIACREQCWQILDVMQKHLPGFENAYIEQTASTIGVRESRRIKGIYYLTIEDALKGNFFEDTIALCGCPIDIHGCRFEGRFDYSTLQKAFAIPYRCMITNEFDNLIVTGRPISADHRVHSSLRRMAVGSQLGEVAGLAAVQALDSNSVHHIDVKNIKVEI